jgi:hypothetical protein
MSRNILRVSFLSLLVALAVLATSDQSQAADWLEKFDSRNDRHDVSIRDGHSDSFVSRLFGFRPWSVNRDAGNRNQRQSFGLPIGRRYFGGRYFGSFNNRYYGPQYGNF